jgi:hypothetical protein
MYIGRYQLSNHLIVDMLFRETIYDHQTDLRAKFVGSIVGRTLWKKWSGYHRRSLVETKDALHQIIRR